MILFVKHEYFSGKNKCLIQRNLFAAIAKASLNFRASEAAPLLNRCYGQLYFFLASFMECGAVVR